MDAFDNCRICLGEINHEPIKMTRLIMRFLEKVLQLTNVAKPNPRGNVKQNLCAPCFNRISDFQDFLEQCKDSDEFWKAQFDESREIPQKELSFAETVLLPLAEDSNLEADTTVSTTQSKNPILIQSEEKDYGNTVRSLDVKMEQSQQVNEEDEQILSPASQITEGENEDTQIEVFNGIELAEWPDETNDEDEQIEANVHSDCDPNVKHGCEEVIEYEYKMEEEEVEIEEITTDETGSSNTCIVDYRSFDYEKIEMEKSSKSTVISESTEKSKKEQDETAQNTFLMATSIDENGKIKMSYKCSQCDKSFNRIHDIESHCNIHNGIKPFTCNVCGKSFRQKNILTTHQALHYGKKVECAECGKKFARRSQLILHYRMHRDEKPFECNIDGCQAAFRQRKQLIDHSFIHTGKKNFQCATCAKSFYTRKRLQDHIYKVHSQYRYRCDLCGKTFLKPHMLKHHIVIAHNMEVDDVSHLKILVDVIKPVKKIIRN